jgi:Tfp pilus assembly protein FimT
MTQPSPAPDPRGAFQQGAAGGDAPGPPPGAFGSTRYRAFISYSTAADHRLAPALQKALPRYATPWWKLRAFRVFRDETGLAVTPALWSSIEAALRQSAFFILLASPEAAASPWVEQEVDWWVRRHSTDRLLLVLTEGEILWDRAARDFDWNRTTALPRRLKNAFAEEPRFLDMRWARNKSQFSLRHPGFADSVARLAATLRGEPLEDLIGTEIRQHRKTIRLLVAASTVLAVLAAAGLYAAFRSDRALSLAGRLAASQQAQTDLEAAQSLSRSLTGKSRQVRPESRDLAILLAARAVEAHATLEAEAALREAVAQDLQPALLIRGHSERETYGRFDPATGARLVTWGGVVARAHDASGGATVFDLTGHEGDILDARFSNDGRRILTSSEDGAVRVWDASTGAEMARFATTGAGSILLSARGDRMLSVAPGGDAILWDVATKESLVVIPLPLFAVTGDQLAAFDPTGARLAICGDRGPLILDATTGARLRELDGHDGLARSADFDATGEFVATAGDDDTVRVWRVATGETERMLALGGIGSPLREARFSPDGASLATRTG